MRKINNYVIWHKPYYHIKPYNNQLWLFDYQELKPLALVLSQSSTETKLLYKAIPDVASKYGLPADYNPTVVPIDYSVNEGSIEAGHLLYWHLESEDHPGGSRRNYSLTREKPGTNWRLTSRYIHYEIANSSSIDNPRDLVRISSDYEPYIELQVQKEGWPENSDQYQRTDMIYRDILVSHGSILWFPAWKVFGEDINRVVPWSMVNVPGYGVSSASGHEILPEDFSYNIPTGNPNISLVLRQEDRKSFKANLRNDCLVFEENEEFELNTSLSTKDGLIIQLEFYLPTYEKWEQIKRVPLLETKIDSEDFKISLVPQISENYFDSYFTEELVTPETKFLVLVEKGTEFFWIYTKVFDPSQWYVFSFTFFSDKLVFESNGLKVNEKEGIDRNIWENLIKLENPVFLFKKAKTVIKSIQVLSYGNELIHPAGHFIDYKMIDYYQLRTCSAECPWALPHYNSYLKRNLYEPKKLLNKRETQIDVCPFVSMGFDPFRKAQAQECSGTSLVPINVNYPQEFTLEEIQSPHYKVNVSIDSEPFSANSIIDQPTCKLLFDTFEEWRPVSRVANYEIALSLTTDFTGVAYSLFQGSNLNNWTLRATIVDPTADDSAIYISGNSGFETPKDLWRATHNLKSTDILGQAYTFDNKLVYANKQAALNLNNYMFDFTPNRYAGFALMTLATRKKAFNLMTIRPFYVTTGQGTATASILQVKNPENFRQEISEFLGLPYYLRVEILNLFEAGNVLVLDVDQMYYVSEPSKVWLIKHNTGIFAHFVQVYNEKWKSLKPSEVIFLDHNTIQLQFDTEVKGTVGLKHVGNPYWKQEVIENIVPKEEFDKNGDLVKTSGYFRIGNLNNNNVINWNYGSEFSKKSFDEEKILQSDTTIRAEIVNFYETEKEYVFVGYIPAFRSLEDMQVREIGLFDKNDNLCFYAQGTLIHVVREFEFNVTFKISKESLAQEQRSSLECTCEDCKLLQENDCIACSFRERCPMRLEKLLKEVQNG